jgi:hypothetical protein
MSQYHFIGADGQEYGPVEGDVLRQWIAEQRANAQSRVRLEGASEWRLLGEFAEFAAALEARYGRPAPVAGAQPPLLAAPRGVVAVNDAARAAAREQIRAPAVFLLVVASCGLLLELGGLLNMVTFQWQPFGDAPWVRWQHGLGLALQIPAIVFSACLFGLAVFGAASMLNLKRWGWALAAAIVMIVPCTDCCCCLGLFSGVWSLIVLTRPGVRSAFES